jgi:N-acetylneuraminic acid mutarotase
MKLKRNFLRIGLLLMGISMTARAGAQNNLVKGWNAYEDTIGVNQAPNFGIQGVPDSTNQPGGRDSYASWVDASGNLWLFGGEDSTGLSHNDLWMYNAAGKTWTWVSGEKMSGHYGVYGTKGVAAAGNEPPARSGACSFVDHYGVFWLFGGYFYGVWQGSEEPTYGALLNDLWSYDPHTGMWTWVSGDSSLNTNGVYGTVGKEDAANKPGARYMFSGGVDLLGNFWFFGGYGYASAGSGLLNDVWKYSPRDKEWTWMAGSQSANPLADFGAQGYELIWNTPGGREGHSGWIDRQGYFWIFGGYGKEVDVRAGYLNDVWRFNTNTGLWAWITGSYNINTWGIYNVQGQSGFHDTAGARVGQTIAQDGDGVVWMFGGRGYDEKGNFGLLNDLWKYNPSTNEWVWMAGEFGKSSSVFNFPIPNPAARASPGAWIDSLGNFWLMGGTDNLGHDWSDIWVYDLALTAGVHPGTWTWENGYEGTNSAVFSGPDAIPGARDGHSGFADPTTGNFYVFGGAGYDAQDNRGLLNDLWMFRPDSNTWTLESGDQIINSPGRIGPLIIPGLIGPGNQPGARTSQSAWMNASQQAIYVFGGNGIDSNGKTGDLSDIWTYDPVTKKWTWVGGSDTAYTPLNYGSPGKAASTNSPGGREYSSIWMDAGGNLWLFGGFATGIGYFDDLWKFSPSSGEWTWVKGDQTRTFGPLYTGVYGVQGISNVKNNPGAREMQSVLIDNGGNFWLYGGQGVDGYGQFGVLGDLWEYSPAVNHWTWMSGAKTASVDPVFGTKGMPFAEATPGARMSTAIWPDPFGNFWLMGGMDAKGMDRGDLWMYTPANPIVSPVALPIQEVLLSGVADGDENLLSWQTIDELNTGHFVVQRSIDGIRFDSISTVAAVGSGNNSYSFTDLRLPASSVFFYRLSMVDKDGSGSYSQTIILHVAAAAGLSLYPNPARDMVTLQLKDNSLVNTPLSVLDIDGHLIREVIVAGQQQTIDLSGLARGIYLLRLANGSTLRFLKE